MDFFDAVFASPMLSSAVVAMLGSIWPVWRSFMRALKRRADQAWTEHGDDDDQEIAVQRVTDKVRALSLTMNAIPRIVVEKTVRAQKESRPSGSPPGGD